MLTPDFEEAIRFLQLLSPGEITFTFQTIVADKEEAKKSHVRAVLNRVFHGSLAQFFIRLGALNNCGAGVFVMVNHGDGIVWPGYRTCRAEKNVVEVRALFVDLDGAPLNPVLNHSIHPDIVVESSPGKWHAYWRVTGCPLKEFTQIQEALAATFNGDKSVKDLPRVMRLPGFYHNKREPFMTRIVYPEK